MHSRLIIAAALSVSLASASPLLQLAQPRVDPTRMQLHDGSVFLPHIYTQGGETGITICWWVRWECPAYESAVDVNVVLPALTFQGMSSLVPAKPTTRGGAPLKSFYKSDAIELDDNASWGMADIIPEQTTFFPGNQRRYAVCCNITSDTDITLTVGGTEKFVPSTTNKLSIFNIEVYDGDRSIAISAADKNAKIKAAFAINPIVKFYETHNHQCHHYAVQATNTFSFACLRVRLEDGQYKSQFNLFDLHGNMATHSLAYDVDVDQFPKDCLFQMSQFTVYGRTDQCGDGSPRKVDIYGLKSIPYALSDEQMWRIYDVDLAEIKARGLTNALPYKR